VRIEYELQDPDKLEAVLTIRMSVAEFKELRGQLDQAWPSWKIGHAINTIVSDAEKKFSVKVEAP